MTDRAGEYQAIVAFIVYSQIMKRAAYTEIARELELHAAEDFQHAKSIAARSPIWAAPHSSDSALSILQPSRLPCCYPLETNVGFLMPHFLRTTRTRLSDTICSSLPLGNLGYISP